MLPIAFEVDRPENDEKTREVSVTQNLRVLVVEDDPDVRRSTVMLLTSLGCEVTETATSSAALSHLARESGIEVLLSDVVLAGGDNGIELARKAVRQRPDLGVILVSGYPEVELAKSGLQQGEFLLLPKPFTREDIIRGLRTVSQEPIVA